MKKPSFYLPAILIAVLLLCVSARGRAQDSIALKSQMLDIKLQLLDSKLDLLDTKIKLWESKPKELDLRLAEIDSKVKSMEFDPAAMTRKIDEVDSLVKVSLERPVQQAYIPEYQNIQEEKEPLYVADYNSAIMLDPVRLLEGTFYLSYERKFSPSISGNLGLMATYSTDQGLSNMYFKNQSFALFDAANGVYQTYQGEVMSGWGVNLQFRNYLLANHPGRRKAPYGLYAAPQLMYRKMTITGNYQVMEEVEPGEWELVDKEVVQHLGINAGGVILGIKVPFFKVLALDIFAGGNIRLSKYRDEDGFTKYKDWSNIDFSGVSPVAGISVGILK